MKLFRTALTVILVALWPLATGHCRLEQLPAFAFLQCGEPEAATHAESDCDTDGCAVVETGSYRTEDRPVEPTGPVLLLVSAPPPLEPEPPPSHRPAGFLTVAAPDFPVTWQFSLRTALPPRAPSPLS